MTGTWNALEQRRARGAPSIVQSECTLPNAAHAPPDAISTPRSPGADTALWQREGRETPSNMVFLAERLTGRPAEPARVNRVTQLVFYATSPSSLALTLAGQQTRSMVDEPEMTRAKRYARAFAVGVMPWSILMLPVAIAAGTPGAAMVALSPMGLLASPLLSVSTAAFQICTVVGTALLLVALAELCRPDSVILPLFGGESFLVAAVLVALLRG